MDQQLSRETTPEAAILRQLSSDLRPVADLRQALTLSANCAAQLMCASKTSISLCHDGALRPYARYIAPGGYFEFRRAQHQPGTPLAEDTHPIMYSVLRLGQPHIGLRHGVHDLKERLSGAPPLDRPDIFYIVEPLRLEGQSVGVMAINLTRDNLARLSRARKEALQQLVALTVAILREGGFKPDVCTRRRSARPEEPAPPQPPGLEKAVLESLEEAVLALDLEGRIIYANPAAVRTFGYGAAQLQGMEMCRLAAHPEEGRRLLDGLKAAGAPPGKRKTRFDIEFEAEFRAADGQAVHGRQKLCPLHDERGRFIGAVAIVHDISALRRLQGQAACLAESLDELSGHGLVGVSQAMRGAMRQVELVARTDSTVLILGETGTGKELVARAIHELSPRHKKSLVKVHCAALSPGLIESEFFGHEKGAFTGALGRKIGRFELADGGTIFLDEVGDIPLETQVKLLRVIQEREFERVGGTHPIRVDVRIVAATNRDIHAAVEAGAFREDLYYRLNVFPIHIPALRERVEAIPVLAAHFAYDYAKTMGKPVEGISGESLERLRAYGWPGNVRELRNIIERAVITSSGPLICVDNLGGVPAKKAAQSVPAQPLDIAQAERSHIVQVLEQTSWRIGGPDGAAALLNINPSTLRSRMKKLRISRPAS